MKYPTSVSAVILMLTLTGCGSSEVSSTPSWEAPDGYEFTLDSSCGERSLIGKFRVVVADGAVVEVEGLDESGRAMLEHGFGDEVPTLSELLEQAANAEERGADVVEVQTSDDGHPTEIDIDWDTNATDDEACYRITDYASGS